MFKKIRQFFALDSGYRRLFLQAWFLLGWARAATLTISFKLIVSSLQHYREKTAPPALELEEREQAMRIGRLVAQAARYTPWKSPCLVQVLVVQRLLARRGIPGQFHLGVRKGETTGEQSNGLQAHAWLVCDDLIVNGDDGHEAFTVVSTFGWGRL